MGLGVGLAQAHLHPAVPRGGGDHQPAVLQPTLGRKPPPYGDADLCQAHQGQVGGNDQENPHGGAYHKELPPFFP